MTQNELSQLTDQELMIEAKKMKTSKITNSIFIGFLLGVIFYSIVKNSWGIFTLIPLFFIYKLVTNAKKDKPLEEEMKARNLKVK
ncbi:FUSC family protein [Flavobacterium sp. 7A]|uniref:FUSC family protein n=1 Tax=Flavobacterium sp. 7A TaxID=2940571 RepID=UPI0022273718|nr:FUSC family protein [Flavobacterium sp. 7A]MCW2121081.1 hypothetical protein [Flavobacterium sp. 7A]